MLKLWTITLLLIWTATPTLVEKPKLKSIFNGKNLKGWEAPEGNIWWSVKDGVLSAQSGPEQKGSILWTEDTYKDFIVELEFKFGDGTVDSGIFMRNDHDQIQIGISGSLKRDMTCSPYIPGKGYPVEAEGVASLLKMDDWNLIRVKAVNNMYTAWLNGEEVMQYTSDSAVPSGRIGLQLHPGRDMHIDFRNIRAASL